MSNKTSSGGLKTGAIGLYAVLFMAIANAAPITAMSFNVPIAIGYGNGIGASAGYLFATIVLTIFTIGFVAMARYITTAGTFYGFISHGLGQVTGMAMGLLATVAYVIFEGAIIGGFSYFASDTINSLFGISINWLIIAILGMLLIWVLTYFDIRLTAVVLSVTLVCEVLILGALGLSVLFKGGGPDGLMFNEIVPILPGFANLEAGAFGTGVAQGTAAVGLFFAFWSWVGYETTAVYGEESRDPKTIIPKATLIAVVGLGLFYTFLSWMVVAGTGAKAAVEVSAGAAPVDLWLNLVKSNLSSGTVPVYRLLLVVGSFACAMAFHNAASRYLYALGRELPSGKIRNSIGTTHPDHQSPVAASTVVTALNVLMVVSFAFFTNVYIEGVATPALIPYVNIYGVPSLVGTAMILIVQTVCSFAVVSYFWIKKVHTGNVVTTLIAPLLGAAGMLYALYLLVTNLTFAAGLASGSLTVKLLPWYVIVTFLLGIGYALWLKSKHPSVFAEVGRTVFKESHER